MPSDANAISFRESVRPRPHALDLIPAAGVLAYPFVLDAFHRQVGPVGSSPDAVHTISAAICLLAAFAVPSLGLYWASRPAIAPTIRRFSYAVVVAPTLYVFLGVLQTMARSPVPDEVVWVVGWTAAASWATISVETEARFAPSRALGHWRVAHGISGAVVLVYVLFHLTNHLFGLAGPDAHAAVMAIGRKVYRNRFIEPVLVAMLLFQIASGAYLAWKWSVAYVEFHRLIQVATGFYLSAFVLGHMNSVFFYARGFLGIQTNWAFATGAPAGIIHDPWNIRLLPHYALGVFFVLAHVASGARGVMLAHGVSAPMTNRLWALALAVSAVVATFITAALCGVRIHAT